MDEKDVRIVIPASMNNVLRSTLRERSLDGQESFAMILAGRHRSRSTERILARSLIVPEEDCYRVRSGGLIELLPGFNEHVLAVADKEKLALVQVHTHIMDGRPFFSHVDDGSEGARAAAIHEVLGLDLASIVFDRHAREYRARKWVMSNGNQPEDLPARIVSEYPSFDPEGDSSEVFDRQVRAFGAEFQLAAGSVRVGVAGLGGMGNAIVSSLSRLGVKDFVLVDHDHLEHSNLNRMIGATIRDAARSRSKVSLAASLIKQVHGKSARVKALCCQVENDRARKALADCDILIAATDNHSSRLFLQKVAAAYHRPLVHAGVGLEGKNGKITQIIGRVAAPPVFGSWCLFCGGIIDPELAGKESGDPEHLRMWKEKGYLKDTPDPAVMWVNNLIANRAVATVHNLIYPFHDHSEWEDVYVDMLGDLSLRIDHPKTGPDCPLCSPEGLAGLGDLLWDEVTVKGKRLGSEEGELEYFGEEALS